MGAIGLIGTICLIGTIGFIGTRAFIGTSCCSIVEFGLLSRTADRVFN